jgi:hypothetical protein
MNKAAFLLALLPSFAFATDAPTDPWAPLTFLVGTWQGDGKAESATGKGGTTFSWDLEKQILVRRDRTEYAATAEHPAFTYEALMVFYKNPASNGIEASYFDNGNHVLHYRLASTAEPGSLQFLSDAPAGPVFRLSYRLLNPGELSVTFDMKAPAADAFQQVAAGVVHKQ